jgi:hypothetical protein
MAVTANRLLVLKRMVGSFLRSGWLYERAIRGVLAAGHKAVTVQLFSQTGLSFGDKQGYYKG